MPDPLNFKEHSKYAFVISFIIILVLSFFLLKSFIKPIIGAILISYIFHPFYKKVLKILKNKNLSALLVSIIIILIIVVPIVFTVNALINESVSFFYKTKDINLGDLASKFSEYLGKNIDINLYLREILNKVSVSIMQGASNFILNLPTLLIDLFVVLFITFYLFKDGETLLHKLKEIIPLKEKHRERIAKKFNDVIYATIYGVIVTGIIQGTVGMIGLIIFDVPSPLLWGLIMIILSILPFIGPWLIWLPAAIVKIVSGETFKGIGLLVYGAVVVSFIDNIVRPKIIGSRANIHPVLVLIGALGGLYFLGLIGLIIGPLILAILMVFLDIYLSEKNETKG